MIFEKLEGLSGLFTSCNFQPHLLFARLFVCRRLFRNTPDVGLKIVKAGLLFRYLTRVFRSLSHRLLPCFCQ
jgi:hypothetical protein